MEDEQGLNEYMNIVHHCFDVYLSMGILRLKGGCDFSKIIGQEEQIAIPSDGDAEGKKVDDDVSDDGEPWISFCTLSRFWFSKASICFKVLGKFVFYHSCFDSRSGSASNQENNIIRSNNVVVEKHAKAKTSVAIYHGIDGNPLGGEVVSSLTQFQVITSSTTSFTSF